MNKTLIIKIILSILIIFSFSAFVGNFYFNRNKISIQGKNEKIIINDIYILEKSKLLGKDLLFLYGDAGYNLYYYIPNNTFNVYIEKPPYTEVKNIAENKLIEILGIKKITACKLNISIFITTEGSEFPDVENKFSFCTDSGINSEGFAIKIINFFKNPLTVALGAAFVIVAGIILFARR